ncbi:hypothetical protein LZ32DRAFT_388215 [Colletotrichum eremochloae]|nr:hypothetical protein LZ32DRAFT_388215 [Colletotrichum eremochloae]
MAAKVVQGATACQSLHRSHVSAAASAASKKPGTVNCVSPTMSGASLYITHHTCLNPLWSHSSRALSPPAFLFPSMKAAHRLPTPILESLEPALNVALRFNTTTVCLPFLPSPCFFFYVCLPIRFYFQKNPGLAKFGS